MVFTSFCTRVGRVLRACTREGRVFGDMCTREGRVFDDKCVLDRVGFFKEFVSKSVFLQIFGATRQFFSCIQHFGL